MKRMPSCLLRSQQISTPRPFSAPATRGTPNRRSQPSSPRTSQPTKLAPRPFVNR